MRIKSILLMVAVAVYGLMLVPTISFAFGSSADQKAENATRFLQDTISGRFGEIPPAEIQNAAAVAVFPQITKAAFLAGARYGQGLVSVHNANGWSDPVFVKIMGLSGGAQAGFEHQRLVLVFNNGNGVNKLLNGEFKLGADATVVAGSALNWSKGYITPAADITAYATRNGLFAGVSLNGARVSLDRGETADLYNTASVDPAAILTGQMRVRTPYAARDFRSVLAQATTSGNRNAFGYYGQEHRNNR